MINPYGAPAKVVRAAADHQVQPVVTQHLLDELAEVLARPKFRRWVTVDDATAFVDAIATEADVVPEANIEQRRVRDPDDDYLVALAEAADATIVSGDADLLEADLPVPVVSPRTLIEQLGQS